MSKYGIVAELAVTLCREEGLCPPKAWAEAAGRIFQNSKSSQMKGCPKGAFLGLAGAGLILGIPAGDYGKSSTGKNASYAIAAAELIRLDQGLAARGANVLWLLSLEKVCAEMEKKPNSQMEVVLSLHSLGLLL